RMPLKPSGMAHFLVQDQQRAARTALDHGQIGPITLNRFLMPLLFGHLHLPRFATNWFRGADRPQQPAGASGRCDTFSAFRAPLNSPRARPLSQRAVCRFSSEGDLKLAAPDASPPGETSASPGENSKST